MVWEGIEELHRVGKTRSNTGAMRDAHEQKAPELEDYLEAFPRHEPFPRRGNASFNRASKPSSARFANTGEITPP